MTATPSTPEAGLQLVETPVLPQITGSQAVLEAFLAEGVDTVFGYPGGAIMPIYDALYDYGEKIEHSGPVYSAMKVNGNKIELSFNHVGGGLVAKDGKLTGFTIAGADQKFVAADAEIKGKKIIVSSTSVAQPVAVRFGWENWPVLNLWNKAGLPATPFRTDDFPMVTAPNPQAKK